MPKHVIAIDAIHKSQPRNRYARVTVRWSGKRRQFFRLKYLIERWNGCFLLVVLSPMILGLWLLVKLTSRGPGFYRQTRVGLNRTNFEVFKLRSMRNDAESNGQAIWCTKGDNRMTWLGRILRKLHLDELPQLLNVARGEMTLVGPRPERPKISEELKHEIDGYYDRVLVKPGITGLSQIHLPSDTSLEDVCRKQILDLSYINETNAWFEIRILMATALRILGLKGKATMQWMRVCHLSVLGRMALETEPANKSSIRAEIKTVPRRHGRNTRPDPVQPQSKRETFCGATETYVGQAISRETSRGRRSGGRRSGDRSFQIAKSNH